MRRYSRCALVGLAIAALFDAPAALAGGFEVKGAEVTKGETEVGFNSAYFTGFPVNADRLRSTGEITGAYSFSALAIITFVAVLLLVSSRWTPINPQYLSSVVLVAVLFAVSTLPVPCPQATSPLALERRRPLQIAASRIPGQIT